MRFMILIKATKDSEAGVMPSEKLLADMAYVPATRRGDSPLANLRVRMLDPVEVLNENDKWSKLYEETLRGAR